MLQPPNLSRLPTALHMSFFPALQFCEFAIHNCSFPSSTVALYLSTTPISILFLFPKSRLLKSSRRTTIFDGPEIFTFLMYYSWFTWYCCCTNISNEFAQNLLEPLEMI